MVIVAGLDDGEAELYSELCVAICQRDRAQKECENLHKRLNQFKDLCHRQHDWMLMNMPTSAGAFLAYDKLFNDYNKLKKEMEHP